MAIRKVSMKLRKRNPRRRTNPPTRRPRVPRRIVARKQDYARLVESAELPIVTNAVGVYTINYTTSLSDFQRAQEVAHAYKYYRCAKIELEFVPYATQAFTNGPAAQRMPQLYFTLDRVNNMWIIPTEAEMLERGVSPRLFKTVQKFMYRPNLLQHVQLETEQAADGGGNPLGINRISAVNSVPLFNKWLPTQQSFGFTVAPNAMIGQQVTQAAVNPYALKYYGAVAVIDIEGGNDQQIGDLMTKVTWEFKGPRALKNLTGNIPEPVESGATSTQIPGVVPNTQPTTYP